VLVALHEEALAVTVFGFCARERCALAPFQIGSEIEQTANSAEARTRAALPSEEFQRFWARGGRLDVDGIIEAIGR
jgi:hypothetical protein